MSAKTKTSKSKTSNKPELIEPAFPMDFLDAMTETGFNALIEQLKAAKQTDAAKLADSLYLMISNIYFIADQGGKSTSMTNSNLMEAVADITRYASKLGAKFYTESGEVKPSK
jgi:hypothetical protein